MRIKEAIEVLKNMNPNQEVTLTFNKKCYVDPHDPDQGGEGSDHPCGGRYETQAEYFGH